MTVILAYLYGMVFVTDMPDYVKFEINLKQKKSWGRRLYCIFFAQVDMKIMYYELIKMLIEYERNKQPEVKDKTRLKLEISKICDKKAQKPV